MADAYVYLVGLPDGDVEALGRIGRLGPADGLYLPFVPYTIPAVRGSSVHRSETSPSTLVWSFSTDELVCENPLSNVANALLVLDVARRVVDGLGTGMAVGNGGLEAGMLPDSEIGLATAAFAYPVAGAYAPSQIYVDRTCIALDFWNRITFFNTLQPAPAHAYAYADVAVLERMLASERSRLLEARRRAEAVMRDEERET
jgi:hypothetical protein